MNTRCLPRTIVAFLSCLGLPVIAQQVIPELDSQEKPGERPYEMVWAHRTESEPPLVRFDRLEGWKMEVQGAAQATLQASLAQNVWDRPVGRLRYQGDGKAASKPRVYLYPPEPVSVPSKANCVELWVFGNRWDWENPPDTPPVEIFLRLRDGAGQAHEVRVDRVRWKEWWLLHRRLPAGLPEPVRLERLEIAGGWQTQPREIYLDSVRFFTESLKPIAVAPRPQRNLELFAGQSPGANAGPGRLPFPTRPETILPEQRSGAFENSVAKQANGDFVFGYRGKDGALDYYFNPAQGLAGVRAECNHKTVGVLLDGAGVALAGRNSNLKLQGAPSLEHDLVTALYEAGTTLQLRIWQKSLVIDVTNQTGTATELRLGRVSGAEEPRRIWMPYMNLGGPPPYLLLAGAPGQRVFASIWVDWYRSNGSEMFGASSGSNSNGISINGGVRYIPRTDGRRNPLFERLFVTVSPLLEEVLPTIPNPVGLHAAQAVDRLWQESWGPDNYAKQEARSERLRAYGIEKLIQCNHEISWRDGGESFTLRRHAAPKKGGDEALIKYVAHQRQLDWLAGLYSNYTDYAPVNEYWSPDAVQRAADGDWRSAWPRCYALKPLKAVEFDAILAPEIKQRFNPNSAYTDVHTAVAPWHYNDYDARVPGAGTFAQTFYAYGELLRNDSRVYGGPIFSEGSFQWLYAGLADGNYALAYDNHPLAREPLLPVFDLLQIHPRECDIGMGWTAQFCGGIPNWNAAANLDRSIDRFLLHTLAYGHLGWLVEEEHGLERTCRSYYMLQAVQARYGLKTPERIAYWDGQKLRSTSEAVDLDLPRLRRQIYVQYPGGLELWCNDHPTENWEVRWGTEEKILPPAGWVATTASGDLLSFSALAGTNKVDYLRCPDYTFLDGRGHWFSAAEAAANGALAIKPLNHNQLQVIHISGEGPFEVKRPYGVRGSVVEVAAYNIGGKALEKPVAHDDGVATRLEPVAGAIRYVLSFRGPN